MASVEILYSMLGSKMYLNSGDVLLFHVGLLYSAVKDVVAGGNKRQHLLLICNMYCTRVNGTLIKYCNSGYSSILLYMKVIRYIMYIIYTLHTFKNIFLFPPSPSTPPPLLPSSPLPPPLPSPFRLLCQLL